MAAFWLLPPNTFTQTETWPRMCHSPGPEYHTDTTSRVITPVAITASHSQHQKIVFTFWHAWLPIISQIPVSGSHVSIEIINKSNQDQYRFVNVPVIVFLMQWLAKIDTSYSFHNIFELKRYKSPKPNCTNSFVCISIDSSIKIRKTKFVLKIRSLALNSTLLPDNKIQIGLFLGSLFFFFYFTNKQVVSHTTAGKSKVGYPAK